MVTMTAANAGDAGKGQTYLFGKVGVDTEQGLDVGDVGHVVYLVCRSWYMDARYARHETFAVLAANIASRK